MAQDVLADFGASQGVAARTTADVLVGASGRQVPSIVFMAVVDQVRIAFPVRLLATDGVVAALALDKVAVQGRARLAFAVSPLHDVHEAGHRHDADGGGLDLYLLVEGAIHDPLMHVGSVPSSKVNPLRELVRINDRAVGAISDERSLVAILVTEFNAASLHLRIPDLFLDKSVPFAAIVLPIRAAIAPSGVCVTVQVPCPYVKVLRIIGPLKDCPHLPFGLVVQCREVAAVRVHHAKIQDGRKGQLHAAVHLRVQAEPRALEAARDLRVALQGRHHHHVLVAYHVELDLAAAPGRLGGQPALVHEHFDGHSCHPVFRRGADHCDEDWRQARGKTLKLIPPTRLCSHPHTPGKCLIIAWHEGACVLALGAPANTPTPASEVAVAVARAGDTGSASRGVELSVLIVRLLTERATDGKSCVLAGLAAVEVPSVGAPADGPEVRSAPHHASAVQHAGEALRAVRPALGRALGHVQRPAVGAGGQAGPEADRGRLELRPAELRGLQALLAAFARIRHSMSVQTCQCLGGVPAEHAAGARIAHGWDALVAVLRIGVPQRLGGVPALLLTHRQAFPDALRHRCTIIRRLVPRDQ
mmetsp:Transcript_27167/g.78003  ORF Transcript_27167/g.78003 Transcript_27167/m.78003 type:complete len:588 (+) Transcript_27167:738-2501(+)